MQQLPEKVSQSQQFVFGKKAITRKSYLNSSLNIKSKLIAVCIIVKMRNQSIPHQSNQHYHITGHKTRPEHDHRSSSEGVQVWP
jgi:hypothetical protein